MNCLRAQAHVHFTHAIYFYLVKLEHTLLYDLFIIIFVHSVLSPYCCPLRTLLRTVVSICRLCSGAVLLKVHFFPFSYSCGFILLFSGGFFSPSVEFFQYVAGSVWYQRVSLSQCGRFCSQVQSYYSSMAWAGVLQFFQSEYVRQRFCFLNALNLQSSELRQKFRGKCWWNAETRVLVLGPLGDGL